NPLATGGIIKTECGIGGALPGSVARRDWDRFVQLGRFEGSSMSRSLSRLQAVILGVVVLTGLALATTGLYAIGSRQWLWGETFHVVVGFPQIRGVEAGTRVRVQGIDAGEVETVEPP